MTHNSPKVTLLIYYKHSRIGEPYRHIRNALKPSIIWDLPESELKSSSS